MGLLMIYMPWFCQSWCPVQDYGVFCGENFYVCVALFELRNGTFNRAQAGSNNV